MPHLSWVQKKCISHPWGLGGEIMHSMMARESILLWTFQLKSVLSIKHLNGTVQTTVFQGIQAFLSFLQNIKTLVLIGKKD